MDYTGYNGPMVGVGVIVRDPATGKVLMGKRTGSHGAGEWALPGGKVDGFEHPAQTSARELYEEAGIHVTGLRALPFWSNDIFPDWDRHFITLYLLADWQGDQPRIMEPAKCLGWDWFDWNNLPHPRFTGLDQVVAAVPDLSRI